MKLKVIVHEAEEGGYGVSHEKIKTSFTGICGLYQ